MIKKKQTKKGKKIYESAVKIIKGVALKPGMAYCQ
jgi:hypothetical protein